MSNQTNTARAAEIVRSFVGFPTLNEGITNAIAAALDEEYERAVRDAADWLLTQYGKSVTTTMPVEMMSALLVPPKVAGGPWSVREQKTRGHT